MILYLNLLLLLYQQTICYNLASLFEFNLLNQGCHPPLKGTKNVYTLEQGYHPPIKF